MEEILLLVLPILNDALAVKDLSGVTEASCTIITVLVAKGTLTDQVLDGLMEAVAGGWPEATIDVRLICLTIIAQRRAAKRLSKAIVKQLLLLQNSADLLVRLSKQYRVDRLALGYVLGCIARIGKTASNSEVTVIKQILQAGILSSKQLRTCLSSILKQIKKTSSLHISQRQSLAALIVFVAGSNSLQDVWRSSFEKADIDVPDLEKRLEVRIPQASGAENDSKVEVEQTEPQFLLTNATSLNEELMAARKQSSEPRSFMTSEAMDDFAVLSELFTKLAESSTVVFPLDHEFMRLPILREGSSLEDPTFVSFFLRIESSNFPARTKATALRILGNTFSPVIQSPQSKEILLPHLIVALSDDSQNVRRASAIIIKQMGQSKNQGNQDQHLQWSSRDLYPGLQSNSKSPPNEGMQNLLDVLLAHLQPCVLDRSVLPRIIQTAFEENTLRKSTYNFLASHAVTTSPLFMQIRLLPILAGARRKQSELSPKVLVPFVENYVQMTLDAIESRCKQERLSLQEVTDAVVGLITENENSILCQIIAGEIAKARSDTYTSALRRLRSIWSSMDASKQDEMAVLLLETALEPSNDHLLSQKGLALETLESLKLSTEALTCLLSTLSNAVQTPDNPPATKRRRTSRSEMARVDIVDKAELSRALHKYTVVLELVERSEPQKHPSLLKPLFNCFGEIQHYKAQADSSLVYLQGLVIDSLLAIVNEFKDNKQGPADTSAIRADLLVDCLRQSTNSQVQSSTLLLISALASWVPDIVLHSVMPIFTFMGSTILRQSDDYSAHVIDQTVSRVLPPLAASLRKSSRRVLAGVADLLQSFVAAFEHMPLHRRLGLFEKVIRALGPGDCLFAALVMLVDRYPADAHVRQFLVELLNQFDAETLLLSFEQYVDLLADMQKARRDVSQLVLGLKDKSTSDIRGLSETLLATLSYLLESSLVQSRIAKSFTSDGGRLEEQRKHYGKLVQNSVNVAQFLRGQMNLHEAAERLLSSVFYLLPFRELLRCTAPLLDHSESAVGSVLLQSITEQCRKMKSADDEDRSSLLQFVDVATSVIEKTKEPAFKQAAIACVDQISERFGKADTTSKILSAAHIISGPHALGDGDRNVRIFSLLCLATMVEVLRDDFIGLVSKVASQTFDYLQESVEGQSQNATLHNACFALIDAIIEYVPFVFSGKLLDRSLQLAQRSRNSGIADVVAISRMQFYELLTKKDAAEVFPALKRNSAIDHLNLEYLHFAKAVVEHHAKSNVVQNSAPLFEFLLQGFDCRRNVVTVGKKIDEEYMDRIEKAFIDIAVTTTMKLNDATFRPFFIRIVEWVDALGKGDPSGKSLRATALFRFFAALSENLKSLLTSYSAYILDLTAELLQTTDSKDENADRLLISLLAALYQSFDHDEDDFWQAPAHFESICAPLLSRLETSSKGMLTDAVIPTITSLAAAAGSADHHKTMNGQLLKLMRSESKAIRLAAVKCEHAITDRLGEDWLNLLSEMLPTIRELLEDDDEEVERETRRWVKRVEEVLGENLDGMLQ